MTLGEFHNGIRVLHNIDSADLGDPPWWEKFRDDPVDFFIRCDDERCELIWQAMLKRGVRV